MGDLLYPSLTLTVARLLHQGIACTSAQIVSTSESAWEVLFGCVGIAYTILLVPACALLFRRYVSAEFHTYDCSSINDGRHSDRAVSGAPNEPLLTEGGQRDQVPTAPGLQQGGASAREGEESLEFAAVVSKDNIVVQVLRRFVMPIGKWEPPAMKHAWGSLFASTCRREWVWSTLPLWTSIIIGFANVIHPSSGSGCQALYGILAAVQLGMVVLLLVSWPCRSRAATILSATSSAVLCAILSATAVTATDPGNSAARSLIAYATQLVMILSVVRVAHNIVVYFGEKRLMGPLRSTVAFELVATHRLGEPRPSPPSNENDEELSVLRTSVVLSVPAVDSGGEAPTAQHEEDEHKSNDADVPSDTEGAPTPVRRVFTHDSKSRELYHAVEEMLSVMRDDRERERLHEEEAARERLLWDEADDILAGPPSHDAPVGVAAGSVASAAAPAVVSDIDEILLGPSTNAGPAALNPDAPGPAAAHPDDDIMAGPPPPPPSSQLRSNSAFVMPSETPMPTAAPKPASSEERAVVGAESGTELRSSERDPLFSGDEGDEAPATAAKKKKLRRATRQKQSL